MFWLVFAAVLSTGVEIPAEGVSNMIGGVILSSSGTLDVPRMSTLVVDSIENLANGTLTIANELDGAGGQIRLVNIPARSELRRIAYGELGVTVDAAGWLVPRRKHGFAMSLR